MVFAGLFGMVEYSKLSELILDLFLIKRAIKYM